MLKEADKIKRKLLKYIGFAYLLLGVSLILLSFQRITGFAVNTSSDTAWGSFTAIISLLIGIIVLSVTAREKESTLESKLRIDFYNSRKGPNPDDSFFMSDPELYFSRAGRVSLGEFKKQIAHLRQEKHGEELVNIAKEAYGHKIKEIAQSQDSEKSRVALAFLRVFEPDYQPPRAQPQPTAPNYQLTKKEREEIKSAFRIWEGYPNSAQREVMHKYNLEYETPGGEHPNKIRYKGTGHLIPAPNYSGNRRQGLNMLREIYKLIERGRREAQH